MTDQFAISDVFLQATGVLLPKNAVAAIILDEQDRALLQLRDDKPEIFFPNHWGCFGGAIEADETPRQTLIRELAEEINVFFEDDATIRLPEEKHIEPFIRIAFNPRASSAQVVERHFFVIRSQAGLLERITLGEGRDVNFFTFEHVMRLPNVTPYDKFALWLYFNQHRLSE